jgi:hypothetical protein
MYIGISRTMDLVLFACANVNINKFVTTRHGTRDVVIGRDVIYFERKNF